MAERHIVFRAIEVLRGIHRVMQRFIRRMGRIIDTPRYFLCLMADRPYFGPAMLAAQPWPKRIPHMRRAIQTLIDQRRNEGKKDEFRVLEIGSWAGNSAIIWGTELIRSGYPGKIYCVDPWAPIYRESQIGVNVDLRLMNGIARRDMIFSLFWHNVKSSGLADVIIPIHCRSADVLSLFKPLSFDLVFVDGSHAYTDFLNDLYQVAPLVKESGFICGDDLELQSDEVDLSVAEQNKEKDFIPDPKTHLSYHPSVCLGVARFFDRRVSAYDGFWIARKETDQWMVVGLYGDR